MIVDHYPYKHYKDYIVNFAYKVMVYQRPEALQGDGGGMEMGVAVNSPDYEAKMMEGGAEMPF